MAKSLTSWSSRGSVLHAGSMPRLAAALAVGAVGPVLVTPISADALASVPGVTYYPLVALAAWLGRLVGGLWTVVLSTVMLAWALPPAGIGFDDPTALLGFAALAAAIAALVSVEEASRWRSSMRRRQQHFLVQAMSVLQESLDPTLALQRMADHVVPSMAAWCAIHLLRPDRTIEPVAVAHEDPEKVSLARAFQATHPVDPAAPRGIAEVIRSGTPTLIPSIDDAALEAAAVDEEARRLLRELDLRSVIIVPLVARGRTLGALTLATEGPDSYREEDLELAVELARRAALSLGTLEALARSRRAQARAETLQRLMAALSRAMTAEEVIRSLVDAVIRETDARATLVALLDDERRWLEVAAYEGYEAANVERWSRFPVSAPLPMSEAVRTRAPVIVADLDERAARYPLLDPETGRPDHTLICLPLLLGSIPLGGIAISLRSVRDLDEAELALLDAVTRQGAASLRRARLYQERDRLATALQRGLLPPEMPSARRLAFAARYLPASEAAEIGGDFYDVLERDRDVILIVGDVCGRGAEAASLMGIARYAAWGAAVRGRDLGSILAAVNDVLLANVPDDRFVTMAVVQIEVDASPARLRVASGGHPPPLRIGNDGARPLGTAGPLLGVVPGAAFPVETFTIAEGESVLLYTDGVVERSGRHVPLSEDPAFVEALSGADLGDPESIVKCVEGLLDDHPRIADDAAILVASVTRPAEDR